MVLRLGDRTKYNSGLRPGMNLLLRLLLFVCLINCCSGTALVSGDISDTWRHLEVLRMCRSKVVLRGSH